LCVGADDIHDGGVDPSGPDARRGAIAVIARRQDLVVLADAGAEHGRAAARADGGDLPKAGFASWRILRGGWKCCAGKPNGTQSYGQIYASSHAILRVMVGKDRFSVRFLPWPALTRKGQRVLLSLLAHFDELRPIHAALEQP
jgi:hypothetical protein